MMREIPASSPFPPPTGQELLAALEPQIVRGADVPAMTKERSWGREIVIFGVLGVMVVATGYAKYRAA